MLLGLKYLFLVILVLVLADIQITHSQNRRTKVNARGKSGAKPRVGSQKGRSERNTLCKTTNGFEGICQSTAYCFSQYSNIELYNKNKCSRGRQSGICCPNVFMRGQSPPYVPFKRPISLIPAVRTVRIDRGVLRQAIEEALKAVQRHQIHEQNLIRSGYHQRINTAESYHQAFFGPDNPNIRRIIRNAKFALETSRQLSRRLNLTPLQARDGLQVYSLLDTPLARYCPQPPRCQPNSKYRTIDGSCNNLQFTYWGQSNTQFIRLLPPKYSDGINELRISVEGGPLPGPRELSNQLAINGEITDKKLTVMFMQWGQFMDHDLTLGASTRANTGEGLVCCNQTRDGSLISHPACKPIIIPTNDPFYSRFNQRCNNFVRNAAAPRMECNLGFRDQINVITHFMDGSMIYGNNDNRSRVVRTFRNGLLLTQEMNGREFLPFDTMNNSLACTIPRNTGLRCVFGGDVRVNQQLGLTLLQLLFLREHNRIARILQDLNPGWSDQIVFEETRRIIGAQIQVISYNEWLPLILGQDIMKEFGLLLQPSGHCFDYNPNLNPGILNEFAGAAFRWHTLVQGFYNMMNSNGQTIRRTQMRSVFNNPSSLYSRGAVDESLYGVTGQASQEFDGIFTEDIRNFLFPGPNASFGMDLISLNIQRGRDHGLPTYNDMRELCGLPVIRTFKELSQVLRPGSAQRFSQIYRNVDDIDLFIAGVHEIPISDGILGPVFACVVAEQFHRTKFGDRYWFEGGNMDHSFSEAQLNELRKVSLASIICQNGDNIQVMQPLALLQPAEWNRRIDCSQFPSINLDLWRNERV